MTTPGTTAEEALKNRSWRPEGGGERTYQSLAPTKGKKHSKLKEIYRQTATVWKEKKRKRQLEKKGVGKTPKRREPQKRGIETKQAQTGMPTGN